MPSTALTPLFSSDELPQVLAVLDRVAAPAAQEAPATLAERLLTVCAHQGLSVTRGQLDAILAELQTPVEGGERARIEAAWRASGSLMMDRATALVAHHRQLEPVHPRTWLLAFPQQHEEATLEGRACLNWQPLNEQGIRRIKLRAGQSRPQQRLSLALALGVEAHFLDHTEKPTSEALWAFAYALLVPEAALLAWVNRPWWQGGRRHLTARATRMLARRFDVEPHVITQRWAHLGL